MRAIRLADVRVVHHDGTAALDGVSLLVPAGAFTALIGPSGSGKSTLLRVVAGLQAVTAGQVLLGGRDVTGLAPRDRDVALVRQDPHLESVRTVAEHLGFPLEMRGIPAAQREVRVAAEARSLRLASFLRRRPRDLPAAARQRVALGRATARVPSVLLLDEPLHVLDPAERQRLRLEIRRTAALAGATVLYATNDHREVIGLADRIAVLRRGRLAQEGTAAEIIDRPATTFVATFIDPTAALVPATVHATPPPGRLRVGGAAVAVPGGLPGPVAARDGAAVLLAVRPHLVTVDPAGPLPAAVATVERHGSHDLVTLAVGAARLVARVPPGAAQPGARLRASLDVGRVSVFDPGDGSALYHLADRAG